jgi:predicted proteasome-type protease
MYLIEDVYSSFRKAYLYGQKGDKVILIADKGNVLIVQGLKEAFPVLKTKVR